MAFINVFIFLAFCSINVYGLSTHDKTDHEKYHKFYKQSANPFKDCKDILNGCKAWESLCDKNEKVKTFCKRTCGLCPAVSPMSCHMTKFGCCWDNITTSGDLGAGCPACEDKKSNCMKAYDKCIYGHIRRACPITCGVRACIEKTHNCFDHPEQVLFCPLFKESGFCLIDEPLMAEYCRKTCGLCDTGMIRHHRLISANIGLNPPREVQKKSVLALTTKLDQKKVSVETASNNDEKKIQKSSEDSTIQKKTNPSNIKDSKVKTSDEEYMNILQELTKKNMAKQDKEKAKDATTSEETVNLKKEKKTAADLEKVGLVKDELEKKTEDLLNDLIQDTLAQQQKQKKEINNTKQKKDTKTIAELEASLLDLLLKERSKDAK